MFELILMICICAFRLLRLSQVVSCLSLYSLDRCRLQICLSHLCDQVESLGAFRVQMVVGTYPIQMVDFLYGLSYFRQPLDESYS